MVKKFSLIFLRLIVIIILIKISIEIYKNTPTIISKNLKNQISKTCSLELNTHSDWLWQENRAFIFDVIYMNILSPGDAILQLKSESVFKQIPIYTLEAIVKPNDFFKKIYDTKMIITSTIEKETKLPLRYYEESFTPEKKRSKEIIFKIEEKIAEREGIKFRIPDYTYDPLSVFFNFLDKEFKIGETIILNLLSKEDIYEFKVTPLELKNNIYKLNGEVFRKNRSSTHGARFMLWVQDGKVRVPLLIKVISAAGPVYLRLKEVK